MASNATAIREPLSNRFTLRLYMAPGGEVPPPRVLVVMAGCIQDHE